MEVKVEKLPKSTVKLIIKIESDKVKETYQHVLSEFAEETEMEGFRKGKAPLPLVEKTVKEGDLNGETINHLLRQYYTSALKEHMIKPVGNPKVIIKAFSKDADFEFEAEIAVKPDIALGDYKSKLKQVHLKKNLENKDEKQSLNIEDVIFAVSEVCEFSDILVEEEVNRMLGRLLQQAETLGLNIEQYLSAQNKTVEQLRKEYEETAKKNIKAEFALSKAIEQEDIKVEDSEIEEAINAVPDEKVREELQNGTDRWYIISILAKNKLIKKLIDETEGK